MNVLRGFPTVAASLAFATLAGCATGPTVSELRNDVRSATLVQHGTEPLNYKFGVVDGASFWAKAADSNATVAVPFGAGTVAAANVGIAAAAAHGRAAVAERAPTVAEIMAGLFNRHPLVNDAGKALLPKLAQAWGVPYNARAVRIIPKDTKLEDESGHFLAFQPTTDVVLVFAVSELEITEKPTLGGALAAGFTAGFNAKDVSSQTSAALTAYKRDAASGQYRRVWTGGCMVHIFSMDVAFPFPELVKSPEKAKQLWDRTTPKLIENCSQYLEATAKQARG
jgi:hypothetical protein